MSKYTLYLVRCSEKNKKKLMKKDHFTSTWLALREPYDILSRNKNLKKFIRQSDRILDIGAGTGAFSRWCLANNIFFENMMLLDHDQRLLNNTQRITSIYLDLNPFFSYHSYLHIFIQC